MPRPEKTHAGDKWTKSRYFQFIRSALRSAFNRYPVKFAAKKAAEKTVTGHRHRYEYLCAVCDKYYRGNEVQVDHIKPAGTLKDYKDLPAFVQNLFCEADGLQVLCKDCHKTKTASERKQRKPTAAI